MPHQPLFDRGILAFMQVLCDARSNRIQIDVDHAGENGRFIK